MISSIILSYDDTILIFNENQALQVMENQYYLIFDWLDGNTLKNNEITINQCSKIGETLAKIHSIDFSMLDIESKEYDDPLIDWQHYLKKGKENNAPWFDLFRKKFEIIVTANQKAHNAFKHLSANMIISHGDLDPKNVMWQNNIPYAIDWESAGFVNPIFDLLNTAIYWSSEDNDNINESRFKNFLKNYNTIIPLITTDWTTVIDASCPLITWLEYSLKRSLKIECADEKEQQLGTQQAIYSINAIVNYPDKIQKVINILNKF